MSERRPPLRRLAIKIEAEELMHGPPARFPRDEVVWIAHLVGAPRETDLDELSLGIAAELSLSPMNPATAVIGDDPVTMARVALAHLLEDPDYYTRMAVRDAGSVAYRPSDP